MQQFAKKMKPKQTHLGLSKVNLADSIETVMLLGPNTAIL